MAAIVVSNHFSSSDGKILDPGGAHELRVIKIAPIEDHRVIQSGLDRVEVRTAKFLPFGNDDQCVGIGKGAHRTLGILKACVVAVNAPSLMHRYRIVSGDCGAGGEEIGDQFAARRLAHVVGVGLEGQAPEREVPALQVAEAALDLAGQDVLLGVVGFLDSSEYLEGDAGFLLGGLDQRLDILGEAGTTIATAGIEEVIANARVGANALAHHFNVGAEHFGEVGQFVHEADARRQHGVGSILGQFGTLDVGDDQALAVALERRVEGTHQVDGLVVIGTDNDAVRTHEVFDGSAFREEFRVGNDAVRDVDRALVQFVGNGGLDLGGGADRHRTFVYDDLIVGHQASNVAGGGEHVLEVGRTIFVRRSADSDELDGAVVDCLLDIGREVKPAGGDIAADHLEQPGLMDRDVAAHEDTDLFGIHIDADNVIANLGQTGATDQTDITGSNNGDLHGYVKEIKGKRLASLGARLKPKPPEY